MGVKFRADAPSTTAKFIGALIVITGTVFVIFWIWGLSVNLLK